jgi:uncharacterized protein (TIGR02231 family)
MAILLALLLAVPGALRVVVFPDRAQVTRAAVATCGNGSAAVPFEGLTPAADAGSFRALSPDGSVLGVRSELKAHLESFSAKAEALGVEQRKLEGEARTLEDARGRSAQQARIASSFAEVAVQLASREMVLPGADPAAWEAAFDGALQTKLKASVATIQANAELREVQRQLAEVRRKRAELQIAHQRRSYRVEVLVGCEQGAPVHVELSYLAGGAGWRPLYEARADEKSARVELAMYATVTQATGEDWKHATVLLSTAIPRSDATPPEVRTLRVGALEKKAEKKVLVRRDEEQRHAEESGAAAAQGGDEGMEAAAQGLSVQLKVKDPADIAGDGTPARLFVGAHKLEARFAYRTVPKLLPYVFRVADLVNTAPFPLLPGELDAFRKSGFIARTALERVAEGERFHLAFGLEENLKVKRIVVEELQKDAGLFGQNKRFHYNYRFELESHLAHAQQVELSDHLPVSELDDVKVELDDKTTGPRELRQDDGIVTWKVEVPAGAKKSVNLAFHVDVPGSYDSGGL